MDLLYLLIGGALVIFGVILGAAIGAMGKKNDTE